MKTISIFLSFLSILFSKPKVLHLTFHEGCKGEIEYLSKVFDFELETWNILKQPHYFLDPLGKSSSNYLMDHNKALRIFEKHHERFAQYDLIITSDIAPLSRIFLQNNWEKPLLIWVCNRFDINVNRSGYKVFPDNEYLELFEKAQYLDQVEIIGWTNFEKAHAEKNRSITSIKKTIPPTGMNDLTKAYKAIPSSINKKELFFVRDYINEKAISLTYQLKMHGIKSYQGEYSGSLDLKDFKGMIHIPSVMGNFHLWENLHQGIIHFIPSKKFYESLYKSSKIQFWDWSNPDRHSTPLSAVEIFAYCDWYNEKLSPLFVFFDSYQDLKYKIEKTNYEEKRKTIVNWHKNHVLYCLNQWAPIFNKLIKTREKKI